jgi:hypothetical protein
MTMSLIIIKAVCVGLGICLALLSAKIREPFFAFIGGMLFAAGGYFL